MNYHTQSLVIGFKVPENWAFKNGYLKSQFDHIETYKDALLTFDRNVTVHYFQDPADMILAGVLVARVGDARGRDFPSHRKQEAPEIPTQEEIATLLTEAGVAFDPDSYGFHTVREES